MDQSMEKLIFAASFLSQAQRDLTKHDKKCGLPLFSKIIPAWKKNEQEAKVRETIFEKKKHSIIGRVLRDHFLTSIG